MILITGMCLFLSSKVDVNRDITKYLDKNSETRIGMDIMDKEFGDNVTSSLNVMFLDLNKEEKEKIYQELEDISEDIEVSYENNEYYNIDNYTLYKIKVNDDKDSKLAKSIYDKINDSYKNYKIYMSGDIYEEFKTILPVWIVFLAIFLALIILIIMCDSYIEPILFLIAIGMAVVINKGTNIMFDSISSITNAICAILQLALSMDYSIMLINRYRQEKENEKDDVKAMKKALYSSFKSISSSSVTTIVGLIALVFMSFTIGRDLGLVLAKGVLFSLVTIFTCLPALILMFDKLINKTKKKSPTFKLDFLGKFAYKFRYAGIILFVIVLVGCYLFKGNLGILYTDKGEDKIADVFGENNEIALIYNNKNEDKVASFCKDLNNKKIDEVLCYGNTINEKLNYKDLKSKLKDLGSDVQIDDYLLKIVYYKYYEGENNTLTLNELLNFIPEYVYTNDKMDEQISNSMKSNIKKLENFASVNAINKKHNKKEIANILSIKENDVNDLLIFYDSLHNSNKLTLREFLDFMLSYVVDSEYGKELDSKAIENINLINKFANKDVIEKELLDKEMASFLGINESDVSNLYLYYLSLNINKYKMTLSNYVDFMVLLSKDTNYASLIDENLLNQIKILQTFSNLEFINKGITYQEMANILGMSEELVKNVYQINKGDLEIQEYLLTPYEFISSIINNEDINKSLDAETSKKLSTLKMTMDSALNNKFYDYLEMASIMGISKETVNNIYILYFKDSLSLSPKVFVDFILEHQNDDSLKDIQRDSLNNLVFADSIMDSVINNTKYDTLELSKLLNMEENKIKLLYGVYDVNYLKKDILISYKDFVYFLINDVIPNKDYGSSFDKEKINKINTLKKIIDNTSKNIKYDKDSLYNILSKLSGDLDKNLIDLLYIYYGSVHNYNQEYVLTIDEFVGYLNKDIIKDKRFDDFIDDDMREEIISAKDMVSDAYKNLVGEEYSRLVLDTKFNLEDKEVFQFMESLQKNLNIDDSYLIGNSPMALEMSKTFQNELNLITILTIIFIFVVVLVTFKSVLIPTILVLLIQTAVYLTMGILFVQGGTVYFISLLIVQSILMGATIDYAILYTSYYLEARNREDVKNALIKAYNNSIHTILTSSSILVLVTLVVGYFASAVTAQICITISEGTLCSSLLILLLLPEMLASLDKFLVRRKKV